MEDYIQHPTNDDDIEGIYEYLSWHLIRHGASSNCLHFLGVLKRKAEANKEEEEKR